MPYKNKQVSERASRRDNMTKKKKYKLPEHYFCINDMTPSFEVEECIVQECESAGLEISEDEELASERGYDRAFEVVNPYKDKLKKVLEICKINSSKNWDDDFENKAEDEFNEIVKIIEEK
jgi:hypothetical protein